MNFVIQVGPENQFKAFFRSDCAKIKMHSE